MLKLRAIRWVSLSFLVIVAFPSCDPKDPEKDPVNIVSITIDDQYQKNYSEKWIVATNSDGTVQEYKKYNNSETVTLTSVGSFPDNKVTVTLVALSTIGGGKNYNVYTYTDIAVGSQLTLAMPLDNIPAQAGNITIVSTKPTQWNEFFITNKYGQNFAVDTDGGTDTHTGFIISGADKLNIMYRTVGSTAVKHKLLTGVKPNETYNVNVSTFEEYATKVRFDLPAPLLSFVSYGYEADRYPRAGYMLDFHLASGGETILNTGYMPGLTQFAIALTLNYTGYTVNYFKVGNTFPTPNISWPDGSKYTVTDKSITNYTTVASGPMLFQTGSWITFQPGVTDAASWDVASPSPIVKMFPLPEEIRTMHPTLDFSKMKHYQTKFHLSGETYEQYINRTIKGGTPPSSIEEVHVAITSSL